MKRLFTILGVLTSYVSFSQSYTYDNLGRLTNVRYPNNTYIAYSYDANGNRINTTVSSSICPGTQASFYAGVNDATNMYQWQVDQGSGFVNVANGVNYSGATAPVLLVNNEPTSWYGYNYRCIITGPGGTSYSPISILKFSSTWLGGKSIAWEDPLNWGCGGVPDVNMDVIVNPNTDFIPTVNSSAFCRSITLGQNASLNLAQNQSLSVKSNLTNSGVINGLGTVILNGLVLQTIGGNGNINNLTLNNSAGGNISSGSGNMQNLFGTLTLTNGLLTTNGNLTLKSNNNGTARVATITNGNISGNVTVERWIPATGRRYRLLTPTVNTTTSINTNWQEGQMNTAIGTNINTFPGYGTQITGAGGNANGFDKTQSNAPSLYNAANGITPTYIAVGNTTGNLNALTGYFLFIRGDRSIDMTLANTNIPPTPVPLPSSSTTLRATGTIQTGTITTFSNPLIGNGALNLITNPYPSPIDWSLVQPACTNITTSYTLWDPHIGYRGGFVTVNTAGIASAGLATKFIQPGQAFFVESDNLGGTPTVSIQESHKATGNNNGIYLQTPAPQQKFTTSLYYTEGNGFRRLADGVVAVYDNNYSASVDGDDAKEVNNWDENIAIAREEKHLAIEARPLFASKDTLPLFMNNMKQMVYEFQFEGSDFDNPSTQATLIDNFTGLHTQFNASGIKIIPFTITSAAGSFANDRFLIVFGSSGPLPIDIIVLNAYPKNQGIQVDWVSKTEIDMDHYEVEKSADGIQFNKTNSVMALGNSNQPIKYSWFDVSPFIGRNFYRIKAFDISRQIKYSDIVNVNINKNQGSITEYPNPIDDNSFNLRFDNIVKGTYTISLINNLGQQIFNTQIKHAGGSSIKIIELKNNLQSGNYDLVIIGVNVKTIIKFIKY